MILMRWAVLQQEDEMEKIDTDSLMLSTVIVVLVLIISIALSVTISSTNEKIAAMTKEGKNPLEAACALHGDSKVCVAAAHSCK